MLALVSMVAILLGAPSSTSAGSAEGMGETAPPAAQQSILPVHDVGGIFGLGIEIPDHGADVTGVLQLNVAWSPLDWLEISFLLPGATVRLGTPNGDEVVLSGGVQGIGYGSIEGLIIVPFAGAAYRHWLSPATSLGVTTRWAGAYSHVPPLQELTGSVFMTHTFGSVVSLSVAVGGGVQSSGASALTFGSGRLGVRSLPLLRFHLSPVWSIDIDARLLLELQPIGGVTQQYVLGFSAIW